MRQATFRLLAAFIPFALILGCGGSDTGMTAEEAKKVQSIVEEGLNAWKGGEPAEKWTDSSSKILFDDFQWKQGYRLLDFRIETIRRKNATGKSPGLPEALVKITVQEADNSKSIEQSALYSVNTAKPNQVVVGRDPMF